MRTTTHDLADLVDLARLQRMCDGFAAAGDFGLGVNDRAGTVLVAAGWQDICREFHRVHEDTLRGCLESDARINHRLGDGRQAPQPHAYRCANGLWDVAFPLIIAGEHLGSVFTGQFFYEDDEVDVAAFRERAQRLGFDEAAYLEALARVPVFSRERVAQTVGFLADFVGMLGELGLAALQHEQEAEALRKSEERLRRLFETITEGVGVIAADGRIVGANPAAESILRLSRAQIEGRSYDDPHWKLLRPDGTPMPAGEMPGQRVMREKRAVKDAVTGFVQPDGAVIWINVNTAPLLDAQGELEGFVSSFTDFTERKLAEEALRESEQNFRAFFDTVDDIIVVVTPDGRLVYANPAASSKLGYSAAELTALRVLDLHPPDRREEAEAVFAALLRGEGEACPLPLQSRSGALLPVETRVWSGSWGGAGCVFHVSRDLTKEQEALRRFDHLFHFNPAPMAVNSVPEGRFTEVNEAFLSGLGYAREEIIGHTAAELGLFVEQDRRAEALQRLQAQGRVADHALKVRSKDGTILDGLFSMEIVESQGRRSVLTVMSDQTERKRAEQALRESEEKYRILLEESPDPQFSLTPEGRYKYVNRAFAEGARTPAADIIGRTIWDVFPREEADKRFEALSRVCATAAGEVVEVRVPRADGDRYYVTTITPIADAAGTIMSASCSSRDVTALKRAEQDLVESLAAQEAITEGVIAALARSIEVRDPYTAGHQRRVGELAAAMALQMGLDEEHAEGLRVGGMLHDVGKITVPAEILAKPGLLTTLELELIKGHAPAGYEILAAIRFPWPVAEMARQHHEREDGSGYPSGLAGEEILLEARIIAVADVVEAMASHRPYRAALGLEAALEEVRTGAGTRYDADVVAACKRAFAQGFVFSET